MAQVKLWVLANYSNPPMNLLFKQGDIIQVEPALAHFLRTDSPGTFSPTEPKSASAPPANKAVDEPDSAPKRTQRRRTTRKK